MEQDNDFRINTRIEWKTKLYHRSELVTSPTFSLLGSRWYLVYSCSDEGFYGGCSYTAHLFPKTQKSEDKTLRAPFEVVSHIRHPTDISRAPADCVRRRVVRRESVCVWDKGLSRDDIFDDVNCIRDLGEVWLVCLFYGADPSMAGDETESENPRTIRIDEKGVQVSSEFPRDIESLSSDFSRLLGEEILPDVRLECRGRTFQAHRSVLAARSEVFRVMFQNGMLESETGAVKIPDMDVAVLEKLLRFVYTGRPEDVSDVSTTSGLYEAADKYAVTSLKDACSYWIRRNLTVENCVEYLVIADSHGDRDLKAAVLSFIIENPVVLNSKPWTVFSKEPSKLASEVFQAYVTSTVQ